MNKVILIGRLARDPEVRYTQTNKAVARMTIAVDRRFSRAGGDQQQTADFISLVAWEKLAEICGNNLRKGSQISVEGRLQSRSYDAQDGSKRYVTEVVVNEVEFLGSKPQNAGGAAPMGGAPASQSNQAAASFGSPSMTDEEIPF